MPFPCVRRGELWIYLPRDEISGSGEEPTNLFFMLLEVEYNQHQTECHDPIAAIRKERGERIVRVLVKMLHNQLR